MWGINLYPLFQYIQVARLRKSNQAARFSGVTRKPCCFLFSEVTENPLSNSKDTLLCLCGHKNPCTTDWENSCYPAFRVSFSDTQAAQKKNRN